MRPPSIAADGVFEPLDCVFCDIVRGHLPPPPQFQRIVSNCVVFEPLNPHVPGHLLVLPREHVTNAVDIPKVTGRVMEAAAYVAFDVGESNILTSVGAAATQSVNHLHVHVLPRGPHDGLPSDWPWLRPEKEQAQ